MLQPLLIGLAWNEVSNFYQLVSDLICFKEGKKYENQGKRKSALNT